MVGLPSISWKVPAWATSTSEDAEEVDEPPEMRPDQTSPQRFRKTPVRRPSEQTSLLTKAIMGCSENDGREEHHSSPELRRRRSMASNVSLASTADLTSDTGLTSPARTNTPSPPLPKTVTARLHSPAFQSKNVSLAPQIADKHTTPRADLKDSDPDVPRKRSIQFACTSKPLADQSATRPTPLKNPSAQEAPRRPCIKFACPPKPASTQNTPPRQKTPPPRSPRSPKATRKAQSPSTPRKTAATSPATPRPSSSHKKSHVITPRPKYLRADSNDLVTDGSQFHEFACERSREDDWIRHDNCVAKCKLTIDDTLTKENEIRRLAKEAEEEAELEEDDDDEAVLDDEDDDDLDEDEDDEDDEDEDEDEDDEDDEDEYALSEGYHTDEETGFAESDESDAEEDGNMTLWTLSKSPTVRPSTIKPLTRRTSLPEPHSDSSSTSTGHRRRSKMQRIKPQEATDLPDSTDFVCGTLDEDRPLEEAYLSQIAARRNEKLRVIPQDIDPSFPTSEPEDEEDEDIYNPVHHESDDDDFLAGQMEDIHHEMDRSRRRRKSNHGSPRRYHSPPPKRHVSPAPRACTRARSPAPKRHVSPAPRARARSPKPLFDRHSPRRMRSPAPKAMTTPNGTPDQGNHVKFNLAARPGLTTTKSLPRPGVFFAKQGRNVRHEYADDDVHVRGAVDIVKGLEKKRQRRKEKFHQKYCSRARRGQVPERKAQPGRGAERMKELGLLMAGKKDQGNYVLSV